MFACACACQKNARARDWMKTERFLHNSVRILETIELVVSRRCARTNLVDFCAQTVLNFGIMSEIKCGECESVCGRIEAGKHEYDALAFKRAFASKNKQALANLTDDFVCCKLFLHLQIGLQTQEFFTTSSTRLTFVFALS